MSIEKMRQNMKKSQDEIDLKRDEVRRGKMRQRYHFMPETGWMNDPNGLIFFKGKYHFFFQFNPYSPFWGSMHWGHAVSDDMLHWEYMPLALVPSEDYDDHQKGGCFSGSAIEHDGKLFLMYTGVNNHGNGYEQTQCIAWSEDGIHFEKYAGNPVITAPEGVSMGQFRDPKVWKHGETFYMVCAAQYHGRGQALLYRSRDMLNWSFFNVLSDNRGEWGKMWECPDFFQMGDKFVLTFSPIGVGDHTSVYQVGDFDYETGRFTNKICNEIDWGLEYYAPQSFLAPDGRRIMVAWANQWEWMPQFNDWGPTFREGWCGFFNVPREVHMMEDGSLQFPPVREIQSLREEVWKKDELVVTEETELKAGDGVSFELKMKIDLSRTDAEKVEIDLRCGDGKKTICMFDLKKSNFTVDRNQSDTWSKGISQSSLALEGKQEFDIHILSDQSSLEIFTDQYQVNQSNNIYAPNEQSGLKVRAHGGKLVLRDIESYGIKSAY